MNYVGDFAVGSNVFIWFNTFTSDDPSASVTMTNLIDTDIHIYKDDGLTQRQNAAGTAVDIDVDTFVGVHKLTIDTADNTVADFYEAGHDYAVVVEGTTIDAATVNACVGTFSIANRRVAGQMCVSSIESLASQTSFTLTTGEASADNDAYNGCTIIVTDQVTKIQKAIGHISDYTGATRTVTLHNAPLQTNFTMAVGDSVEIIATSVFATVSAIGANVIDAASLKADAVTKIIDDFETQSQADPTGFHVNVKEVNGTAQTANDNGADINEILTDTGTTLENRLIAIEADTNELQGDDTPAAINGLNDISVANILAGVVEGALTLEQVLRILLADAAGKASGGGTTTIAFRDNADSKDRIVKTVDSSGNRSAVVLDGA